MIRANVTELFLTACRRKDIKEMALRLSEGANVNGTDDKPSLCIVAGMSAPRDEPLDVKLHCVQYLLDHGADVNRVDKEGHSPLMFAAGSLSVSLLKIFLQNGASVNLRQRRHGDTALTIAVFFQFTAGIKLLLDYGATLDKGYAENMLLPRPNLYREPENHIAEHKQDATRAIVVPLLRSLQAPLQE